MKKILIFILVGMLMLTGCSSADNTQNSSKEDTKSAISSTQNTDKADKTETTSKKTPNWPEAKESDIYKVEVIAENLDIVDVSYIDFKNGYAIVTKYDEDDNYVYAYMDENGKILGDGFVYNHAYPFDEQSGLADVELLDGTSAIINKKFKIVLKESDIDTQGIKYIRMGFGGFSNGYADVSLMGEDEVYSGIINTKGKLVYGFEKGYIYSNGDGTFTKSEDFSTDEGMEIIDPFGNTIYKFADDEYEMNLDNGFKFHIAKNQKGDTVMGLMDENYNKITEPIYVYDPQLWAYSDLVYVVKAEGSKGVFINCKGEEKLKIDGIKYAIVCESVIIVTKEDGYQYIYDRNGNQLSFRGYEFIQDGIQNDYAVVNTEGEKNILIDCKGNIIYEPNALEMFFGGNIINMRDGYYCVGQDGDVKILKVVKK